MAIHFDETGKQILNSTAISSLLYEEKDMTKTVQCLEAVENAQRPKRKCHFPGGISRSPFHFMINNNLHLEDLKVGVTNIQHNILRFCMRHGMKANCLISGMSTVYPSHCTVYCISWEENYYAPIEGIYFQAFKIINWSAMNHIIICNLSIIYISILQYIL
jgi:hypothetical protein